MKRALLWICGSLAFILLAIAGVFGWTGREDDDLGARQTIATSSPDYSLPLLRREDGGDILLAANPDVLRRLVELLARRDMLGVQMLVGDGLLRQVPSETACEVIVQVPDSPAIKVRVVGGLHDDLVGWVHTNVVYR